MYLYAYENLYPNYNRYLYEVNPTSVGLNINGSWLLGSSSDFSGTATGLVVDLPRVIAGTRSGSTSYHYHYRFEGLQLERQAVQTFSNLPHYGMDIVEDGTIGFTCYSGSSCSSLARKIIQYGDGSITDLRTPTSASSVVTSPNHVTSVQFNALKFTDPVLLELILYSVPVCVKLITDPVMFALCDFAAIIVVLFCAIVVIYSSLRLLNLAVLGPSPYTAASSFGSCPSIVNILMYFILCALPSASPNSSQIQ